VDEHGVIRLETTRDLLPTFRSVYDAEIPCSFCRRLSRLLAGDLTGPVLNTECGVLELIPRDARWLSDGVVIVPLHLGRRVLGALHLVTRSQVAPTGDERRLLTIIGDQYSAAIERARLFDDVQRLAITDSLTGLFTRRHFWTLAQQEFERADRYERPLSVAMLDIDHFKQINDGYGHVAGDRALRAVAEQCRGSLRKVDILARYGGDEFVILLPETNSAKAQQMAERLRQRVAEMPVDTDSGRLSITVSLGIASLKGKETLTPEELVDCADEALYAAKQGGRNQVMAWTGDVAKDRAV
jgi:diguanylate cyclase (GGDEF)-like protein